MNRRLDMGMQLLVCVAALTACRIEREPAASPWATDAGFGAIIGGGSGGDGSGGGGTGPGGALDDGTDRTDGSGGSGGGAAARDASLPDGRGSGGSGGTGGNTDSGTGADCTTPDIAVCNPITNEGCAPELGMRCAVDVAALVPAGYCTFYAAMDAGPCLNTGLTESCPPTTACTGGECRSLCFCDADCEGGQCCGDPIGTQGFKVCGECNP